MSVSHPDHASSNLMAPQDQESDADFDAPSFDIGYRFEEYADETGEIQIKRIPLSRADALHPQEYDEFVANSAHADAINELLSLAKRYYRNDPASRQLSDTNVALGQDQEDIRPDLIILQGVTHQREDIATFRLADETDALRCPLVVEVTSPKTRKNDLDSKLKIYREAEIIEQYVIVDLPHGKNRPQGRILNYLRANHTLELQPTPPNGRAWLPCFNVWIGVEGSVVKFFNADTQEPLLDWGEVVDEAAAQKTRADQAEERIRVLEEQLRQLKAGAPSTNGINGASSPQA